MRLAMQLGGSYLMTMRSTELWPRVARGLGLPPDLIIERARGLMERLPDAFGDAARESSIVSLESTMPGRLVDRVAERVESCRSTV